MQEAYENALSYVLKRDAALIYKAGKGIGTHDSLLIRVLASRTKSQLERIDVHYRELKENTTKRSLNEFIKSECGGDYQRFLKYVAKPRPKFLADQLSKAMDGNNSTVRELTLVLPECYYCYYCYYYYYCYYCYYCCYRYYLVD
jgi:hypothetical protein